MLASVILYFVMPQAKQSELPANPVIRPFFATTVVARPELPLLTAKESLSSVIAKAEPPVRLVEEYDDDAQCGGTPAFNPRGETMKAILLTGAMTLTMINPTFAETYGMGFQGADELYDRCTATTETDDNAFQSRAYCLGFLAAVVDGEYKFLCFPQELKMGQVLNAVVTYLKKNPQERRYLAHRVVVTALNQAFGCK
jgi:hypothetical protein